MKKHMYRQHDRKQQVYKMKFTFTVLSRPPKNIALVFQKLFLSHIFISWQLPGTQCWPVIAIRSFTTKNIPRSDQISLATCHLSNHRPIKLKAMKLKLWVSFINQVSSSKFNHISFLLTDSLFSKRLLCYLHQNQLFGSNTFQYETSGPYSKKINWKNQIPITIFLKIS